MNSQNQEGMEGMKKNENEKHSETDEKGTESKSGLKDEGDKMETEKIPPESSKLENERSLKMYDASRYHNHPLIFRPGVEGTGNSLGCRACWRLIEGSHYACENERCKHAFHTFCFDLPREIRWHPLHLYHVLVLLPGPPQYRAKCRVCGKPCNGFTYHCMRCPEFDIDLLCAWMPVTIKTRVHEHKLSLLDQPAIFSCNACNVEYGNKTFSYFCLTCKYWVHLDCALGPDALTRIQDNHKLEPCDVRGDELCKLCEEEIDWLWDLEDAHGCKKCNRYFHCRCFALAALSAKSAEASLMENIEDSRSGTRELFLGPRLYSVKRIRGRIGRQSQIQHWSHQDHLLKLGSSIDEVPGFDRRRISCNGCKWPLMAPFYSCVICNFFLHAECAELPDLLPTYIHKHSIHGLHIEIISEEEGQRNRCSHCSIPHSGFSYICKECEYRLDPSCAEIKEGLLHHSHQHPLYLLEEEGPSKKCNACGNSIEKERSAYICSICGFYLHTRCASLPMKSRHRFDHHELDLMFKSTENVLGEYICDICEDENRDPNVWFYGCEECDFAAHVDCIRNQ